MCDILALTPALEQLHVPQALSLDAAVLAVLPASLREAAFSVAFDDSCLMDHSLPVRSYAFPSAMPNLRSLDLQVLHHSHTLYTPVCFHTKCQIYIHTCSRNESKP